MMKPVETLDELEHRIGDHYSMHEDGAAIVGAPCAQCGTAYPCSERLRLEDDLRVFRRLEIVLAPLRKS